MKALIGHTGFVGGTLLQQGGADAVFNSSTIGNMANQSFDTIWCAGVSAVKWWANRHPAEDWQGIESLLDVLKTVKCRHFVLISTVDVFQKPIDVDESTPIDTHGLQPYGKHRYDVECFVTEHFPAHTIIRLPGLFGEGLKKNIIYDFMHDNEVYKIHSESRLQFYDLAGLHSDCMKAVDAGLSCVHFATEPVFVAEIAREAFGKEFSNHPQGASPNDYDFKTGYASLWGKTGCYIQDKTEVLKRIHQFVQSNGAH
ncbi:MAG: NAD(P)-dependent oxidoreductase [Burkholderiales bacterium]|jgi:nucleoside-diphosphate-sugar epimerase|nr:NAD(P)-dependent oxidoreductase [Burkholderiales bacterium]